MERNPAFSPPFYCRQFALQYKKSVTWQFSEVNLIEASTQRELFKI